MNMFLFMLIIFCCCDRENTPQDITQPEPEIVYIDKEVYIEKPFSPIKVSGDIYYESNYLEYIRNIDDIPHIKKAFISIDHFEEGLEVVGIVVHFTDETMPIVDKTPAGSFVSIMLIENIRIGVYRGKFLGFVQNGQN